MMFIRHEILARRGRGERRRNFIIASAIVLLLLTVAAIYHFVAAASYDLAGTTGLTSGDITGAVTATDGSSPVNINRDDKVTLDITFGIDNAKRGTALQGGAIWTYDLSSLVGANKDFSAVEDITTPQNIYDSSYSATEPVGTYTISNNVISIEITNDDYATPDRTNIRVGVGAILDLNKVGVGPKNSTTLTLPGSTVDTADTISFKTAAIDVTESVYDDEVDSFKTGNTSVAIDADGSGNYIATYTTEFMTNAYFPDLTTTITLTGDQTFVGNNDFVMATCTSNYCIANSSVSTVTIPSQYITISQDQKTATIQMEQFLYDYCEVGGNCSPDISGYNLNRNMQKNANYADYYIMYHANLGSTNPTSSSSTYTATATVSGTGENSMLVSDSDTVSFGANGSISGSKQGTCVSGATTVDGVTTCNADASGNRDIEYTITVGDNGESLDKVVIEDVLTDSQVLTPASITVQVGGSTTTITSVCQNTGDTKCINPDAIDGTYSKNDVTLFKYDFASTDTGPATFTYTVRIATDATIGSADINNKVNLTIDQTTYNDIWHSKTHYDFDVQDYVHKEAWAQASSGVITWTIRVYGPVTQGQTFNNVLVHDVPTYDNNTYSQGSIDTVFTSAKRISADGQTVTDLTTSDYTVNGLDVTINTIGYNEEVDLIFTSTANNTFKEAYEGRSVQVQNSVYVGSDSSWASATILTPTANTIEKTVEPSDIPGYWHDNGTSYDWNSPQRGQSGYHWTAIINANQGSVDTDYEPYFTDTIPAGLYVTKEGWSAPTTAPSYTGDSSTDISQANFDAYIDVYRVVGSDWQQSQKIPVTVTNGVIQPVNLAAIFNASGCQLNTAVPSTSCAGINGATYYISYYTSIANEIHDDYLSSKVFTNHAYLVKNNSGVYEQIEDDSASITYKTNTAIQKDDASNTTLDDTNTILYVVTVNSDGYAFNNGGVPYASAADRKILTFTDTLESNLGFVSDKLVANNMTYSSAIVCTDNSNVETNDCSFSYDSETHTITGQIPDGVLRKIQFKAYLTEPEFNVSHDFYNKAYLVTDRITFSDDVSKSHIATKPSGWISSDGLISLEKVDGSTFEPIKDAIFNVFDVEYDETSAGSPGYIATGQTTPVCNLSNNACDFSTDVHGLVQFESLNGFKISSPEGTPVVNMGSLYYWVEKSVPSPYLADDTNKHYFMIYNEGSNYAETANNKALAESVANSIIANSNGDITSIAVLRSSHRWVVTNTEQRVADLEVRKLIKGNSADPTQKFTVDITATNSNQTNVNGDFRVEYFNVDNPTVTTLTGSVTFNNGETSIELAHNEGVRIVGLYIGGEYSVEEEATVYTTSYACQEIDASGAERQQTSCTTTGLVEGTIQEGTQIATITNTSEAQVSGIFGNKSTLFGIFTAAGMAMAGFAVIVILKLRRC